MKLPTSSEKLLVRLDNVLVGKPLYETVWDNVSGAFWDVEESQQIGFTQDYATLALASATGGAMGGAVAGGAVVAAAGNALVDTRIVIPFGRIFSAIFQSGLSQYFPNAAVCFDDQCEKDQLKTNTPNYIMNITIVRFKVWEDPMNHINLRAAVRSSLRADSKSNTAPFIYERSKELARQSIGSVWSTSSDFIKEMNRITNTFAEALSEELLRNGVKIE